VAFLAHLHMRTGDAAYLDGAERILGFVARCHDDVRNTIIAHKIMWGASLVGSLAGQARVLMHPVRSIVRWNRR